MSIDQLTTGDTGSALIVAKKQNECDLRFCQKCYASLLSYQKDKLIKKILGFLAIYDP